MKSRRHLAFNRECIVRIGTNIRFARSADNVRCHDDERRVGRDHRMLATIDRYADDVLVVRERIDWRRVIGAEVSEFPTAWDGDTIEHRRVGDYVADRLNSARAQSIDEGRELPVQRWIGSAADDDIVSVEPQFGGEAMIQAEAVDRRRRGEELAVRRRHQQRVPVALVQNAAAVVLNVDSPDRAAQLGDGGSAIDRRRKRDAAGEDEAKRKKNLQTMAHDRGCISRQR